MITWLAIESQLTVPNFRDSYFEWNNNNSVIYLLIAGLLYGSHYISPDYVQIELAEENEKKKPQPNSFIHHSIVDHLFVQ